MDDVETIRSVSHDEGQGRARACHEGQVSAAPEPGRGRGRKRQIEGSTACAAGPLEMMGTMHG